MGYIYAIRNRCNDKVYVGQTAKTLASRMNKHRSSAKTYQDYLLHPENYPNWRGTCTKLYRAMIKYGRDNFYIEQLDEADDDLLDMFECFYIEAFESVTLGYNLKTGGDRHAHSEETKKVISIRTREGVHKHIRSYRTYADLLEGLPPHCIRIHINGFEGVAVNNHPKCKRKSFTAKKYGSIEGAKLALLEFYATL